MSQRSDYDDLAARVAEAAADANTALEIAGALQQAAGEPVKTPSVRSSAPSTTNCGVRKLVRRPDLACFAARSYLRTPQGRRPDSASSNKRADQRSNNEVKKREDHAADTPSTRPRKTATAILAPVRPDPRIQRGRLTDRVCAPHTPFSALSRLGGAFFGWFGPVVFADESDSGCAACYAEF
jgi:hypothetical protein